MTGERGEDGLEFVRLLGADVVVYRASAAYPVSVSIGSSRKHSSFAQLRELDGKVPGGARGAMNDHTFAVRHNPCKS